MQAWGVVSWERAEGETPQGQTGRQRETPQVRVKVKVFIIAYTKFLQRSEILMTWQPTSTGVGATL